MKKILGILKKCFDVFAFCLGLGGKTETGKKAVDDDICDFSGQGRNKYGN